jgi:hypothetical protein
MRNKNYVYEYETTRKRRMLNGLETLVNWSLLIIFGGTVLGGVTFAIIQIIL